MTRNCARCGTDFTLAAGNHRVCSRCIRPRGEKKPVDTSAPLSPREQQITALVIEGRLNKEIASILHLTEGTIKEYLNRLFLKAKVTNRTALAVWALRNPKTLKP